MYVASTSSFFSDFPSPGFILLESITKEMSTRLLTGILRSRSIALYNKRIINASRTLLAPSVVKTIPSMKMMYSTSSVDSQLNEVLRSELKISNTIPNELDSVTAEYLEKNQFDLIQTEGKSNVQLVKTLESGEVLRVFFDIDEVTDVPIQEEQMEGEESINDEIESLDSLLCNVKVLIQKPSSKNGLFMNLFLQNSENSFLVDFVNFKSDAEEFLATQVNKGEFIDKFQYQGPRFSDLDESLQAAFENYLDAKGINEDLAEFIISYSEYKEEMEYRNWLSAITKYLE